MLFEEVEEVITTEDVSRADNECGGGFRHCCCPVAQVYKRVYDALGLQHAFHIYPLFVHIYSPPVTTTTFCFDEVLNDTRTIKAVGLYDQQKDVTGHKITVWAPVEEDSK